MTVTQLLAGQAPEWTRELPGLLAAHGPVDAATVTERLRGSGHEVTAEEVEQELLARMDVHETDKGWLSLLAIAEGSVLTTLLTEHAHETGILDTSGDLDLWEGLADEGIPLAGGGELRMRWAGPLPGLTGPDGWLSAFEPKHIIGLRLRDGMAEVVTADDILDDHPTLAARLTPLIEASLSNCHAALAAFAQAAGEGPDEAEVLPAAMLSDVVAELLAAQPGALADALPPFSALLPVLGFEIRGGLIGLPGTFWHLDDAADLEPDEIVAAVGASTLLRTGDQGVVPGEWCPRFWSLAAFGPAVIVRVADVAERYGVESEIFEALTDSASDAGQLAIVTFLAARAAEADDDSATAADLADRALSLDPHLTAALTDAAEYTAAKGDFAAADALLRRGGHPSDCGHRRNLRPLVRPPVVPGGVSRNKPCPCGSGRKYKACCLAAAQHPLRDRAAARHANIMMYGERAPGRELVYSYLQPAGSNAAEIWSFALDLAVFDGGLVDGYLASRGDWLPADERALVERWRSTPLALYEVVEVRPGSGVSIRQLPGGQPIWLTDRLLSSDVRRLDLFLGRLFDCGDGPRVLSLPARVDRMGRQAMIGLLNGNATGDADDPDAARAGNAPGAQRPYSPHEIMAFFAPPPLPAIFNEEDEDEDEDRQVRS